METKEIIESQEFNNYLQTVIDKYNHRRIPPAGKRWSRTPYDDLNDKGLFEVEKLKSEYKNIALKRSLLSYSDRNAVINMINRCVIAFCIEEQKKKSNDIKTK